MKLSRREVVKATAVATLVGQTQVAQASPQASAATEATRSAREANQRASEALAKFEMPMATEPAFLFRA